MRCLSERRTQSAEERFSRFSSDCCGRWLGRVLALALLVPVGAPNAVSTQTANNGRFTVASVPPDGENAYCGPGNTVKFGAKDGPAQLPQTCFYTGLDGTPSPGKKITVGPKDDLGQAVQAAKCGDTLQLTAGAVYSTTEFPRKNCDDQHYITVRTNTPDSKLPPEGARITPAWGGVASLPGRPEYAQPAGGAAKLLATISVPVFIGIPIGDHYRFIGIEWIPDADKKIARLLDSEGGDHIIFDRNWAHGTDGQELGHGLGINNASYVAVIHSYFNSFTCTAKTGTCTDASAIGGGNKDKPTHALKIVDNFIESSGQNIFFGGAWATIHPEDIEIRRNHLFKPMFWNPNSPEHKDPTPIVKNLFELKNAKRVLFEANLLENSWAGFSQAGSAIVLTPRNNLNKAQGKATCPDCEVTDVTIRYDWVRRINQVFGMANIMDIDKPAPGNSYSIHDVIADGIGYPECGKGCGGAPNMMGGAPAGSPKESVMHDVTIDHVTYVSMQQNRVLLSLLGPPKKDADTPQMYNITWTNTISDAGVYGLWPAGGKPDYNCANLPGASPKERLAACWAAGSVFKGNVLAGGKSIRGQRAEWPDDNYFADSQDAIGYVKLNGGIDGDYHLSSSSKFKGKGTDGRDPGADVDAVTQAVKGVR